METDKPFGEPSSYTPVYLLDVEGKMFQLISARLKTETARTGVLAENQYGFKEGRQTVDAIRSIIEDSQKTAADTSNHRRLYAYYFRC